MAFSFWPFLFVPGEAYTFEQNIMPLVNSFISWLMKKRIHQIELFTKYPHEVQEEWFKKLIKSGTDTEFGEKYSFHSIANITDFKNRLPVTNYEQFFPYIKRIMNGEQNVTWPSGIRWFAKSSGTTNEKSKFIPVSTESLEDCHFKGGKDMLSIYCNNYSDTQIFTGKGLSLGGSHQTNQFNTESIYGDLSAIIIENLPFWVNLISTPDKSIALMDEWESKIRKMAEATMNVNVTNISGVPSWMLVLLKYMLNISGKTNIHEVWPNLEVFFHGAVNFDPYRKQFKSLVPSQNMHYLETYNASEGFFGIQDIPHSDELLLMLDYGIFYEFLPIEEWENEHPETIGLAEVQLNTNYAIVISTNAGLWRYKIGDTIKFTSLSPYRIRITGRTKHFMNAFGEEVIIENAQEALKIACEKSDALIREFTAAPVYMEKNKKGGHEWLIEFEKTPENLGYFTEVLDNALKAINSDYEAKRYKDLALQMPLVKKMPEKTFYKWMKSRGKLGGQNKVPRLANDRKYVEEILELIRSTKG